MMRRGQSNTTQIGGHNMLKAIVVAGFLDDGALQRVHSGIPDKLTMRFHSSARLRQ
jgi:hypothetical protein